MPATASFRNRCWVEIDLDAVRHNADALPPPAGGALLAVVKANAYGHGAAAVARALHGKVALLGVANLHEAEQIEATKITTPIVLLGTCLPEEREAALRDGLQVCVSSVEEAAAWDAVAGKLRATVRAHLVLDTGMGRMGIPEETWTEAAARELLKCTRIWWEGIASHLPSADDDEAYTIAQIGRFRRCVEVARAGGLRPRWVHLGNSAGLLAYPEIADFCNLARPGLAIYGVSPLPRQSRPLKPALAWKTRVLLVRDLPAGHGISYGRTEKLKRNTRVATLACGYGDGYPRQVSGRGAAVLVRGQRFPLLGRVTMDQIMVDVTDAAAGIAVGDEAVLLGSQGNETITAGDLAELAGTIPWHLFTGITARVERIYPNPP